MKEVFGEGKDLVSGGEEKRRMISRITFCETEKLLRVVWVAIGQASKTLYVVQADLGWRLLQE